MIDKETDIAKIWQNKNTCRRYVCYIDIMGFKDMVATRDHYEILSMMEQIVNIQKRYTEIDWEDKKYLVKTSTYSDSIIIYSLDDSIESLISIECTIAGMVNELLEAGIPYKGSLSIGTMTCDFDKSIYFGQPLIDAYLLQEELYFYCVVLHGSVERELEKHNHGGFYYEYNCPFKKGKAKHVTIPPMFLYNERDADVARNDALLQSVNKMKFSTSGNLRIYIESTIEYLNKIREMPKI